MKPSSISCYVDSSGITVLISEIISKVIKCSRLSKTLSSKCTSYFDEFKLKNFVFLNQYLTKVDGS